MINRIAIMGTGSLGTILGAYLSKAGLDVTLVDAWQDHVDALNEKGAAVTGRVEMTVPVKACTPDKMEGTFDLFIYLAKQTFNDTAIPQMIAHCHENTIICTGQNGIPELAVAKYWPESKICGAPISWAATLLGPGKSQMNSDLSTIAYPFHLGTMEGPATPWLYEVQAVLEKMGPAHITEDLMADRWSKVMVNATLSGMSTVIGGTFGAAVSDDKGCLCAVRIGQECTKVCDALGIRMPEIFSVDFHSLYSDTTPAGEAKACELLKTRWGANPGKASMLQDLEKGRKCEIAQINGVVSDTARRFGIATPYCDAVVKIVSEIENGSRPLSADNVKDMP